MTTANTARLLITCEDKPGIVQAVSSFLYHQGANITALDQYATAAQGGRYFMRVEFELDNLQSRKESISRLLQRMWQNAMACNGVWLWSVM